MNYYVYVYKDPETLCPFYIGKGKGRRCFNHLNWKSTFKRVRDKIKSLNDKGLQPVIEIIKDNLSETDAYTLEESLITSYGRRGIEANGVLMNICLGARPPLNRNINFIKQYYDEEPYEVDDAVLDSVKLFLLNCQSRKRFTTLLSTEIGKDFIMYTRNFPIEYTIPQRLYHLTYNLTDMPKCKRCNDMVRFKMDTDLFPTIDGVIDNYGYTTFCSRKCSIDDLKESDSRRLLIATRTTQLHSSGILTGFKNNNPMLTKEGKQKWQQSRKKY